MGRMPSDERNGQTYAYGDLPVCERRAWHVTSSNDVGSGVEIKVVTEE